MSKTKLNKNNNLNNIIKNNIKKVIHYQKIMRMANKVINGRKTTIKKIISQNNK